VPPEGLEPPTRGLGIGEALVDRLNNGLTIPELCQDALD
jgi:hypothetical protein